MNTDVIYRVETLKVKDIDIQITLDIIGLGTDYFKARVFFEFLSCKVGYDFYGNKEIIPLADHYEAEEIESWYPKIMKGIQQYYDTHRPMLFDVTIKKLNELYISQGRVLSMFEAELEKRR